MNNMQELLMMRLYGGAGGLFGSGTAWLEVVFLAFLIAIPVFRPERIRIVSMYRRAYYCFGLSIIVPSTASCLLMTVFMPNVAGGRFGTGSSETILGAELLKVLAQAGPVLFGISVILALAAVVPGFIPPQNPRHSPHGLDGDSSNNSDDSPSDSFSSESGSV